MAAVHIAQVVERLLRPKLRQQDPIRLHAKTGLQELLGRHAREPLVVLAVEQPNVVGVPIQNQLLRILDSDEPLLPRNLPDQRLGVRRLAGSGGPRTPGCSCGISDRKLHELRIRLD
jgi:hypothetical protein